MRIAALYDIHGNLPALEAALAEVAEGDLVLVGGDFAAGPFPVETLERLRTLGDRVTFIRGNADRELAQPGGAGLWAERRNWVREQLGEEEIAWLARLPHPVSYEVEGLGRVLFCHGSPRSDEEIITAITSPKRLDPILDGVQERTVVCGHTHVQFDRRLGDRRLVNAGSIGMPYEGEAGVACWALLGPDVELKRTPYDVQTAAEQIRLSGYPDAVGFVEEFLLAPTSAEEATAHFEGVAERFR